jgi:hypothetical protein
MRIAALIVGLLGALITTGLGAKWVADYKDNRATIEKLTQVGGALGASGAEALAQLERMHKASYVMVVLGLFAIVASVLVLKKSKPSGAVLIAAAVVPAIFAPSTLIFSFLLIIAGLLAIAAKPKLAAQ